MMGHYRFWTTWENIMSKAVRHVKRFLLTLTELSKSQQKFLLKTITKQQLLGLRELVTNLLAGNIAVSDKQLKKLKKYRLFLRKLAKKTVSKSTLQKYYNIIVLFVQVIQPFLDAL